MFRRVNRGETNMCKELKSEIERGIYKANKTTTSIQTNIISYSR